MPKTIALLAGLAALGSACAAPGLAGPAEPMQVRVLYTGAQCFRLAPEPGARILGSDEELSAVLASLSDGLPDGPPPPAPAWDPEREQAVVLSMGTRPTAGYVLSLGSAVAVAQGDRVLVRLRWEEPPPGSFLAQVLTSPCLVLAVPKADWRLLEFVDQAGAVRFRADAR